MAAAYKVPGGASAALGMTMPDDELQRELEERRKKAMQAANLSGKGMVSQMLGMPMTGMAPGG